MSEDDEKARARLTEFFLRAVMGPDADAKGLAMENENEKKDDGRPEWSMDAMSPEWAIESLYPCPHHRDCEQRFMAYGLLVGTISVMRKLEEDNKRLREELQLLLNPVIRLSAEKPGA